MSIRLSGLPRLFAPWLAGLVLAGCGDTMLVGATDATGAGDGSTSALDFAPMAGLTIAPAAPTLPLGGKLTFVAFSTVDGVDGGTRVGGVTWTSSDSTVATIDPTGFAVAVKQGTTTITATFGQLSATTPLTISDAQLTAIAVMPATAAISVGATQAFTAMGSFSDMTMRDVTMMVSWSSSDSTIATVDAMGNATGIALGNATITASYGAVPDAGAGTGVSAGAKLAVTMAGFRSVAVTPFMPTAAAGSTVQFAATAVLTDGTTMDVTSSVTWSSSDMTVAAVSNGGGKKGLASAIGAGTANIIATLGTVMGSTALTVSKATLSGIAVSPQNPTLPAGIVRQLIATGLFSDNTTQDLSSQVTWASSDSTAVIVDALGNATGQKAGSATISATLSGLSGMTTVTVSSATLMSVAVTPTNPSVPVGLPLLLRATGTWSDGGALDIGAAVNWSSSDATVATVVNQGAQKGIVTGLKQGTVTITASLNGVMGTSTVAVNSATLTAINISPSTPTLARGTTQQLTATGLYSDMSTQDLTATVTWSSSDGTVAILSNAAGSKGVVTTIAPGSATLAAAQGNVMTTTALTVTSATLMSISINPAASILAKGMNKQLIATGIYSDGSTQELTSTTTWKSSDATIAAISNAAGSKGVATGAGAGTAILTASVGTVSGTANLSVTAATLSAITVTPGAPTVPKGINLQLTAVGTYSDGSAQDLTSAVGWSSGDAKTMVVSNAAGSQGLATPTGAGMTTLTATLGSIMGTAAVTVTSATLSSLLVTPVSPTVAKGTAVQLTALGIFSDGTIQNLTAAATWSSSMPTVASISNANPTQGYARGLATGSATVTAAVGAINGNTNLSVSAATLSSIAVSAGSSTIAKNTQVQLSAIGTFSDSTAQDLTTQVGWGSGTPSVAAVSSAAPTQGIASSIASGQAIITAAFGGVSGTITLTVSGATLATISVGPANPTIGRGTTQQFTAGGTFSDGSTQDLTALVSWSSSMPNVAVVGGAGGSRGLASGLSPGNATITASYAGKSGTTGLTVSSAMLVSIAVTPAAPTIARGSMLQLSATGIYSDGTVQDLTAAATWTSSDQTVATLSNAAGSQGVATGKGMGNVKVTASLGGISGTNQLTVSSATLSSITVTPVGSAIAKGISVQLSAIGLYSDGTTQNLTSAVSWKSSDGTLVFVSNAAAAPGLAKGLGVGTATLTATLGPVSGAANLTVTQAVLNKLIVTPSPTIIAKGTSVQLTATATFSDGTTLDLTPQVSWSVSPATVASISNTAGSQGVVTAIGAGTATITASTVNSAGSTISGSTGLFINALMLTALNVTPANGTAAKGFNVQYKAVGMFADNSMQDLTNQVAWTSSDNTIAVVGNKPGSQGLAQTVGAGMANIQATFGSKSGMTKLTVSMAALMSIAVTPINQTTVRGRSLQYKALGTFSDATIVDITKQVVWTSSDATIAQVSNAAPTQGQTFTIKAGTTMIAATRSMVTGMTNLMVQ